MTDNFYFNCSDCGEPVFLHNGVIRFSREGIGKYERFKITHSYHERNRDQGERDFHLLNIFDKNMDLDFISFLILEEDYPEDMIDLSTYKKVKYLILKAKLGTYKGLIEV